MSYALALHLLSMAFQAAAAVLALMLIAVSGRKLAWILLALAFTVRFARLGIQTLLVLFYEYRLYLVEETFSLASSVLAFAGVLLIRPIFLTYRRTEKAREDLLKEVELARDREEVEHRHLRTVLETLPVAVWISDPSGKIVEANRMVEKIFAQQASALPEYGIQSGWRLDDGSPVQPEGWPMKRAIEKGETVLGERYEIGRHDGTRAMIILSAVPLHNVDGKIIGAVAVGQDISELHRLQREKEEYNHTVSHDLRTPLTVILGHAQLMQERLRHGCVADEMRLSVSAIETGAERMQHMIRSLTETARLESGQIRVELQPIELSAYLHDLLRRFAVVLHAERIRIEVPQIIPTVLADPALLERIVLNLLTNSLKYSPEGAAIRLSVMTADREAVIQVCDQGPGINPEDLPRLFTRFYRGDKERDREGLGLGLYISRKLAELQGGRIWAVSTVGKGSKFCLALPYRHTEGRTEDQALNT